MPSSRKSACRSRRHRASARAMTLLELSAAVAISTVVVLAVMNLYQGSLRSRQKVSSAIETIDRVRGIVSLLSSDIEQMHVYDDRAYLLVDDLLIDNVESTSIAFASLTGMRVSEEVRDYPGPIEVAYMVGRDEQNPGKLRLFRRELPISINRQETSIRTSLQGFVLLADNLEQVRLEFLPALAADDSTTTPEDVWQKAWQKRFVRSDSPDTALPRAARLILTAAAEGERTSPITVERIIRLPQPNAALEMRTDDITEAMGLNETALP